MDGTDIEEIQMVEARREYARETWKTVRDDILHLGGIARVTEDYRDLPLCVRRRTGFPLDVIAANLGYDYEEDCYQFILRTYEAFTRLDRLPRMRIKRHADIPELQILLDTYYDLWRDCVRIKHRVGDRRHPLAQPIYDEQREARRMYKAACAAFDVQPAWI